MKELVSKIADWAEEKDIYKDSDFLSQRLGSIGEFCEFREAIIKGKSDIEIKTEFGDAIVFFINACYLNGEIKMARDKLSMINKQVKPVSFYDVDKINYLLDRAINSISSIGSHALYEAFQFIDHIQPLIGASVEECLTLAYEKISKRDGEMKNGKFVRQEDKNNGAKKKVK